MNKFSFCSFSVELLDWAAPSSAPFSYGHINLLLGPRAKWGAGPLTPLSVYVNSFPGPEQYTVYNMKSQKWNNLSAAQVSTPSRSEPHSRLHGRINLNSHHFTYSEENLFVVLLTAK